MNGSTTHFRFKKVLIDGQVVCFIYCYKFSTYHTFNIFKVLSGSNKSELYSV